MFLRLRNGYIHSLSDNAWLYALLRDQLHDDVKTDVRRVAMLRSHVRWIDVDTWLNDSFLKAFLEPRCACVIKCGESLKASVHICAFMLSA